MKAESHFQLGNIFYESEFTNYNDPSEFYSTHCNLFATASSHSKLSKSSESSKYFQSILSNYLENTFNEVSM